MLKLRGQNLQLAVSSFKGTRRQKQPGGGLIAALALNEVGVCGSCSLSLPLFYFLYSFDHSLTTASSLLAFLSEALITIRAPQGKRLCFAPSLPGFGQASRDPYGILQ